MNRLIIAMTLLLPAFTLTARAQQKVPDNQNMINMESNTIRLTIKGGKTFTATLENHASAQALKDRLSNGSITVEMNDYGDMEKVGPLGFSLPRTDRQTTTRPGDIILYLGNNLVIYYDTNSWDFTPLGKIDGASGPGMRKALGQGDVTVTLSAE